MLRSARSSIPFDSLVKSARSLTISGIDAKKDRKNGVLSRHPPSAKKMVDKPAENLYDLAAMRSCIS